MTTKAIDTKRPVAAGQENIQVAIKPPNVAHVAMHLRGLPPGLVIHRFGEKAMRQIEATQRAGTQAKTKKIREPKDFDALYEQAKHISTEGWEGIHAASFRNGCISQGRTCGFAMTKLKLAIFVEADGIDKVDGSPLVRIYGKSTKLTLPVRNDSGVVDLRIRPQYFPWEMTVRMRYDADLISGDDVANLMNRVGMFGGIGEGRADSRDSCGLGWGFFEIINREERKLA